MLREMNTGEQHTPTDQKYLFSMHVDVSSHTGALQILRFRLCNVLFSLVVKAKLSFSVSVLSSGVQEDPPGLLCGVQAVSLWIHSSFFVRTIGHRAACMQLFNRFLALQLRSLTFRIRGNCTQTSKVTMFVTRLHRKNM